MMDDPELDTPSEAEKADEMEKAQEDAAEKRENEGGLSVSPRRRAHLPILRACSPLPLLYPDR